MASSIVCGSASCRDERVVDVLVALDGRGAVEEVAVGGEQPCRAALPQQRRRPAGRGRRPAPGDGRRRTGRPRGGRRGRRRRRVGSSSRPRRRSPGSRGGRRRPPAGPAARYSETLIIVHSRVYGSSTSGDTPTVAVRNCRLHLGAGQPAGPRHGVRDAVAGDAAAAARARRRRDRSGGGGRPRDDGGRRRRRHR